jgi:hypothetical protein
MGPGYFKPPFNSEILLDEMIVNVV